jgi:hypothetical protein
LLAKNSYVAKCTVVAMPVLILWLQLGCTTVVSTRPAMLSESLGGRASGRVPTDDDSIDGGTTKTTSTDIVAMTEKMVREILACPVLANRDDPPRIICDAKYMRNLSSDPNVSVQLLATRIRNNLNQHAHGRLIFVARHGGATKILDEESVVAGESAHYTVPADFRLMGEIDSHTIPGRSNYMYFSFEIIDTSTGEIVWSGSYEFKKAGRDPIGYDRG